MNRTLFQFCHAWNHLQKANRRVSEVSKDVSKLFRDTRAKKGLRLDDFSAPMGVTLTTVWNLEQGRKVWTMDLATKAFEALEGKK